MKKSILVLAFSALYFSGFSKVFSGKIIDLNTNEPIANCKILSNWQYLEGITTSSDGSFKIELDENRDKPYVSLLISKPGYISKIISKDVKEQSGNIIIYMKKSGDFVIDSSMVNKNLIGMPLSDIYQKLNLDIYDFETQKSQKYMVRQVRVRSGDGSVLNLFIQESSYDINAPKSILENKIIGAAWINADCSRTRYIGESNSRYLGVDCKKQ